MERFLRQWRKDAAARSQFETAIFLGDKILALTNDDQDAISQAHLYFSSGSFSRAIDLLSKHNLTDRNTECKYLTAQCYVKQGKFEDALKLLGDKNPTHLIQQSNGRRKLARVDESAKSGTVKHHGKARSRHEETKPPEERSDDEVAQIRYEAGMCYLRGICHAKQNAMDRAKECYKDAARIDVQCFEAFDQLMKNALMSPEEEWQFLNSLNFDTIVSPDGLSSSQQAADLTRMLYMTRMSKYQGSAEFTAAAETLSTHYNLSNNADLLLAKADLLFTQCKFREAVAITERILENDRYNFATLPIHLACLHQLNERNALFLLAHDFADKHPEEPASWLAVGVYYLSIGKIAEARRFFSKSSLMDPHFGPAWIGFAHTFAEEGEHDQAIAAYSTAMRLFQGTHLPQLFLGMQHIQLKSMQLASDFLQAAYGLCKTDPLLLNELGVVFYEEGEYERAVNVFNEALKIAQDINSDPRAWVSTRANLGHAYRRIQHHEDALEEFDEVLRTGGRDTGIFTAKGMVLLEMGETFEAIRALHEALALSPQDPIANDLLTKALEEASTASGVLGEEDDAEDQWIESLDAIDAAKRDANRHPARRSGKRPKNRLEESDGGMDID